MPFFQFFNRQVSNKFNFFKNQVSKFYTSSKSNRYAQRLDGGISAFISYGLQTLAPYSTFPAKITQLTISGVAISKEDMHSYEKVYQAVKILIRASELTLLAYSYFNEMDCSGMDSSEYICRTLTLIDVCESGVSNALWLLSEISRDPKHTHPTQQTNNNPA